MPYALIENGSRQHRVRAGESLRVDLMTEEPGSKIKLAQVLAYVDDDGNATFGTPLLDNCSVTASVLTHGKGAKIRMLKMRRRKNSRRRQGHRQDYTELLIEKIEMGSAKTEATVTQAEKKPAAKKAAGKKTAAKDSKASGD